MKIYTKTGDDGTTGLFGGGRVTKDDVRIEAYGTVDELNACLGLVRAEPLSPQLDQLLAAVQHDLFALGAELASPDPSARGTALVQQRHVERLEAAIDAHQEQLEPLRHFILPAGTRSAAQLHVARGVCRRAERRVVTLHGSRGVDVSSAIRYLNRLSDLLFVLARAVNQQAGQGDVRWEKEA